MKLSNPGTVPVYTISGASTARPLPDWLARRRKRSLKNDAEYQNRVELLQDFEFEEASNCIRVSEDGDWIMSTGTYKPQIHVHNTTDYRAAFRLEHVGIMIAHGDTALRKLPMLFATEYADIWSNSSWREVLYGHFHHEVVNDDSGVVIRQLGTPKPSDGYEKKNGYTMSSRTLKLFEYDADRLRVTYDA